MRPTSLLIVSFVACSHPPPPRVPTAGPAADEPIALPTTDVPEEPRSLAVLPVVAKNLHKKHAAMLTGVLTTEVDRVPGYRVTTTDDIDAALTLEKQKDLLDCDDVGCLAEFGGALGVERIIATSVGRVGVTYVINMSLIDAATGQASARATETGRGQPDVLLPLIRRATHTLFDLDGEPPNVPEPRSAEVSLRAKRARPTKRQVPPIATRQGGLTVRSITAGATVVVTGPDGRERKSQLPWRADDLQPGEYRLLLTAPKHASKHQRVRVRAGEINAVVTELEPAAAALQVEAEPDARPPTIQPMWLPCTVGQESRGNGCHGSSSALPWPEAQYSCPAGYRLPMHEELLGLLVCSDAGCLACGRSHRCRELFGDDRGVYWTGSSVFDQAFAIDLGRGAVERLRKNERRNVRCRRR